MGSLDMRGGRPEQGGGSSWHLALISLKVSEVYRHIRFAGNGQKVQNAVELQPSAISGQCISMLPALHNDLWGRTPSRHQIHDTHAPSACFCCRACAPHTAGMVPFWAALRQWFGHRQFALLVAYTYRVVHAAAGTGVFGVIVQHVRR